MSANKKNKLYSVGEYTSKFDNILGLNLFHKKIYRSDGLIRHILKKHPSYINYVGSIPDIIKSPDYIGLNPSEKNSIELVKKYDQYILIAIKLDTENDYLYVASLYGIKASKIKRRLNSGRLIDFKAHKKAIIPSQSYQLFPSPLS